MTDMNIRERLMAMSDIELYKLINAAFAAAGLDQRKTESMTSDVQRLRRMISSLSDRQISALLASLGSRDVGEALRQFGGEK